MHVLLSLSFGAVASIRISSQRSASERRGKTVQYPRLLLLRLRHHDVQKTSQSVARERFPVLEVPQAAGEEFVIGKRGLRGGMLGLLRNVAHSESRIRTMGPAR